MHVELQGFKIPPWRVHFQGMYALRHIENGEGAVALDNGLLLPAIQKHPENFARLKPHKLLVWELAL